MYSIAKTNLAFDRSANDYMFFSFALLFTSLRFHSPFNSIWCAMNAISISLYFCSRDAIYLSLHLSIPFSKLRVISTFDLWQRSRCSSFLVLQLHVFLPFLYRLWLTAFRIPCRFFLLHRVVFHCIH